MAGDSEAARPTYTAEQLVEMMAAKMAPFSGDPLMFSNSWKGEEARKTGIYSEHKAKLVAWARRFAGFYNESMSFCDMMLPNFIGKSRAACPDQARLEYRYYQAVTGNKKSFADTMEIGRKIWNMERAIRVMAGRHRDKEQFAPFMFMPGATFNMSGTRPVYQDGKWSFEDQSDMYLDKAGVELFKTNFYKLEGWDVENRLAYQKNSGRVGHEEGYGCSGVLLGCSIGSQCNRDKGHGDYQRCGCQKDQRIDPPPGTQNRTAIRSSHNRQ